MSDLSLFKELNRAKKDIIIECCKYFSHKYELDEHTKIMINIIDFPNYNNTYEKKESCPISYIELSDSIDKIICGNCKNIFEKVSLVSWLKINYSCPLCKQNTFFTL